MVDGDGKLVQLFSKLHIIFSLSNFLHQAVRLVGLIKVAFKPRTCTDPGDIPVIPHNSNIIAVKNCN
jgi:hypothetical protein